MLKPGKDLDRLVAEHIFGIDIGWVKSKVNDIFGYSNEWSKTKFDDIPIYEDLTIIGKSDNPKWLGTPIYKESWFQTPFVTKDFKHVESYSTDIADAWTVVEKIITVKGDGFDPEVELHRTEKDADDTMWICLFYDRHGRADGFDVFADGDTAPHAICLAALKAVGCDIPDE